MSLSNKSFYKCYENLAERILKNPVCCMIPFIIFCLQLRTKYLKSFLNVDWISVFDSALLLWILVNVTIGILLLAVNSSYRSRTYFFAKVSLGTNRRLLVLLLLGSFLQFWFQNISIRRTRSGDLRRRSPQLPVGTQNDHYHRVVYILGLAAKTLKVRDNHIKPLSTCSSTDSHPQKPTLHTCTSILNFPTSRRARSS